MLLSWILVLPQATHHPNFGTGTQLGQAVFLLVPSAVCRASVLACLPPPGTSPAWPGWSQAGVIARQLAPDVFHCAQMHRASAPPAWGRATRRQDKVVMGDQQNGLRGLARFSDNEGDIIWPAWRAELEQRVAFEFGTAALCRQIAPAVLSGARCPLFAAVGAWPPRWPRVQWKTPQVATTTTKGNASWLQGKTVCLQGSKDNVEVWEPGQAGQVGTAVAALPRCALGVTVPLLGEFGAACHGQPRCRRPAGGGRAVDPYAPNRPQPTTCKALV